MRTLPTLLSRSDEYEEVMSESMALASRSFRIRPLPLLLETISLRVYWYAEFVSESKSESEQPVLF